MWNWKFRCPTCDLPCSSRRGVSVHSRHMYKEENHKALRDDLQIMQYVDNLQKLEKQQSNSPEITCEGRQLDNVFRFSYLGTAFSADSDQMYDIEQSAECSHDCHDCHDAMAFTRCALWIPQTHTYLTFDNNRTVVMLNIKICSLGTTGWLLINQSINLNVLKL